MTIKSVLILEAFGLYMMSVIKLFYAFYAFVQSLIDTEKLQLPNLENGTNTTGSTSAITFVSPIEYISVMQQSGKSSACNAPTLLAMQTLKNVGAYCL